MTTKQLVDDIRRRLTRSEGGFTLAECLVVVSIMGIIAVALSFGFLTSTKAAAQSKERLDESGDNRLVTAYFVPDVESASYFSQTVPSSTNACNPGSNIAVFEWTETPVSGASTAKAAFYYTVGATELRRRYCENSVAVGKDAVLARHLRPGTPPKVSCPVDAACSAKPSAVEIEVYEASGYSFKVRATPRAVQATGSGGMSGVTLFVGGGGMNLQSALTRMDAGAGIMISTQDPTCNPGTAANITPTGTFFSTVGGTPGDSCGDGQVDEPVDPLSNFPEMTSAPTNVVTASTKTVLCGGSLQRDTWEPGRYTATNTTLSGCLKSGSYWIDGNLTLRDVLSVNDASTGGVHLYVRGDVEFLGTTELWPLTTGPQAGVTMFVGRNLAKNITVNKVQPIVRGILYGPASTLTIKNSDATLTVGGLNVWRLSVEANGKGIVGI